MVLRKKDMDQTCIFHRHTDKVIPIYTSPNFICEDIIKWAKSFFECAISVSILQNRVTKNVGWLFDVIAESVGVYHASLANTLLFNTELLNKADQFDAILVLMAKTLRNGVSQKQHGKINIGQIPWMNTSLFKLVLSINISKLITLDWCVLYIIDDNWNVLMQVGEFSFNLLA